MFNLKSVLYFYYATINNRKRHHFLKEIVFLTVQVIEISSRLSKSYMYRSTVSDVNPEKQHPPSVW